MMPSTASLFILVQSLRDLVREQSVLQGIPVAQPWEDLAGKKKFPAAELKRAEKIRGKLNVSRERFTHDAEGRFHQAAGTVSANPDRHG